MGYGDKENPMWMDKRLFEGKKMQNWDNEFLLVKKTREDFAKLLLYYYFFLIFSSKCTGNYLEEEEEAKYNNFSNN